MERITTAQNKWVLLRPMMIVFVFLTAFFIVAKKTLAEKGVDQEVLIVGNLLLFLVSLLTFFLSWKALQSNNAQAFVRAMYGSFIIRFFVLAIAAFIYIMITKREVNRPSLFICMGLYIVYSALEIAALLKLLRKKKNA
jgi:hypothetical protein